MIHFQCDCGTTLSAEESDRGKSVSCKGCGKALQVPEANSTGARLENGKSEGPRHDFDAEIVGAARTAPPRPRRTPARVESPPPESAEEGPAPASYDLIRLEGLAQALLRLSWIGLVLLGLGAGAVLALLGGSLGSRVTLAGILLALAVAGFIVFRVLSELCRSIVGLAGSQRETMASLARQLRRRSPR